MKATSEITTKLLLNKQTILKIPMGLFIVSVFQLTFASKELFSV